MCGCVIEKMSYFVWESLGQLSALKKITTCFYWTNSNKGENTSTSVLLGTILKCYRYFQLQIMQHFGIISRFLKLLNCRNCRYGK